AMTVDPGPRSHEDTYRALLERVFRDLGPEARAVLNLGSILGSRMNDLRMYQLVDLSLGQAMAGLARLMDLRLLRDAGRKLEFRNEVIRAYAYLNVPSPLRRELHGSIADRLLAAEEAGEWVPGLELAWHCLRAGRPEQAKAFLLRGARESIQDGAPYAAERALESAAGLLIGTERTDAALIIAQAQVEQGSFSQAIRTLSNTELCWAGHREEIRHTLFALASALAGSPEDELQRMLSALWTIMTSTDSEVARTNAAYSASIILQRLRKRELAARFLERILAEPAQNLDLSAHTRWLLAKARLADLAGCKAGLQCMSQELADALSVFEARGVQNALTDLLHTYIGCIQLGRGNYADASTHFRAALSAATHVGNDAAIARCQVNLAITAARLGNYSEASQLALRALETSKARSDIPRLVQTTYLAAWSNALAGNDSHALQLVQCEMPPLDGANPQWLIQAADLWTADVHYTLGRRKYALALAAESLDRHQLKLLSDAQAGVFARWLVLTALNGSPRRRADISEVLGDLCSRLAEFDLIDQAEILSSAVCWHSREGSPAQSHLDRLNDCLAQLPQPVLGQLRHLGVLP
ncbi:MAG TPA: tetratricopeptide repeat protein, partial [Alphaproteobacteria bacterium]|nr:tetratricopeptide repeat protein [Alphaproteobacteria bacterium]